MSNDQEQMRLQMLQRRNRIEEAEKSFAAYLASPLADNIIEMLTSYTGALPLMRDNPQNTAFQLGLYSAIQSIETLQKRARGIYT